MTDHGNWLQIADGADILAMRPRSTKPDDTIVASIGHRYASRSVLLSRAKVAELHEFTGKWLAEGWDGVPQVEGPTTADDIEHFRDIAVRYQIAADHARIDGNRRVDAALALIPAEHRSVDLEVVAKAQSEIWRRLQTERDDLEELRCAWLMAMFRIADLTDAVLAEPKTAPAVRTYITKALAMQDRILASRAGREPKGEPPDAPIYDVEQLALF